MSWRKGNCFYKKNVSIAVRLSIRCQNLDHSVSFIQLVSKALGQLSPTKSYTLYMTVYIYIMLSSALLRKENTQRTFSFDFQARIWARIPTSIPLEHHPPRITRSARYLPNKSSDSLAPTTPPPPPRRTWRDLDVRRRVVLLPPPTRSTIVLHTCPASTN